MCPKKRTPRNAKNKRGRDDVNQVEVGKEYKVNITEMSPNGEGVARIRGLIILVPNAKVGEQVQVRIIKVDSMSAEAELTA
jgi:predicted RNA-binding protein with TRAM domain